MKILYTIPAFQPVDGKGGPPVSAYNLCSHLVERGHKVTVYTTDLYRSDERQSPIGNSIELNGIKVRYFKNASYRLAWDYNISNPIFKPFVLRKELPLFDIVHVDLLRGMEPVAVNYFANKYNVPYILQPRGSVLRIQKYRMKRLFDQFFGEKIVSESDAIIASSNIEQQHYHRTFSSVEDEKIVQIPNGINVDQYRELPEDSVFRDNHDIPRDCKVVLYLGRLHERKGGDLLVKAMEDIEDAILVFVGPDDGHLETLRALVEMNDCEERVKFVGPLYGDEKLAAYRESDLFVLPSRNKQESFGNVVLESLACGTPAIVSKFCGVSQWLSDDVIVKVNPKVPSLTDTIKKLLRSPETRESMGKKGRNLVFNEFNWNRVAADTEDAYRTVL
jgi:glycosyltransferase involved in cell wall biosynthesis